MNREDMDEMGKAMHALRVSVAEMTPWPRDRVDWALVAVMVISGIAVGIGDGLGWWTPAYAALLGAMQVATRWFIVMWARGR